MQLKLLFLLLMVFKSLQSPAQTEKGSRMAGISLSGTLRSAPQNKVVAGYGFSENGRTRYNIQTDLKLAYFILNNVSIGFSPQLLFQKNTSTETLIKFNQGDSLLGSSIHKTTGTTYNVSFNPFIRFYGVRYKNIGIFLEGSAGISLAQSTQTNTIKTLMGQGAGQPLFEQTQLSEPVFNYTLGAGLNYFFSPKAALELSFFSQNFSYKKLRAMEDIYTINFTASLGFNYYF
jgi:hypothetical protein